MRTSTCANHVLTFDEKRHRYALDGQHVPGVTTINKRAYPESEGLLRWRIQQGIQEYETGVKAKAAAGIGTLVHEYAHATTIGDDDGVTKAQMAAFAHPEKEKVLNGIKLFDAWKEKQKDTLVGSEILVASPKYKYAGTIDLLVQENGRYIIRDYKTGKSVYQNQYLQLALYAIAAEEWLGTKIEGLEVVRFGKEEAEVETKLMDDPKTLMAFKRQGLRNVCTYYFRQTFDK